MRLHEPKASEQLRSLAMLRSSCWRKRLVLRAGLLLEVACGAAPTHTAQDKTEPKKGEKKADPKKAEAPPKQPVFIQEVHVGASGHEQIKYVNELLQNQWNENKVVPSERCSDYEFI